MKASTRVTVSLCNDLLDKAREYSGIKSKSELVRAGLEVLIARGAAHRLAQMGGTDPSFKLPRRRRVRVRTA